MRIIRFLNDEDRVFWGSPSGNGSADVLSVGRDGERITIHPRKERADIKQLLAPIDPPNIFCAGRNYPGSGVSERDELELFMKPTTAIAHPNDPVFLPGSDGGTDPHLACEGELAIVIGRRTRNVSEGDALDHILGYTLANDVTARRWQTKEGPPRWMRGKGFDGFCPLGPAIVTPDELPAPDARDLQITTRVNGEIHRTGRIADMIRSVPRLIAEISQRITLLPGTIILTGSPGVVDGVADVPLTVGDRLDVQCDAIGTLSNTICSQ